MLLDCRRGSKGIKEFVYNEYSLHNHGNTSAIYNINYYNWHRQKFRCRKRIEKHIFYNDLPKYRNSHVYAI